MLIGRDLSKRYGGHFALRSASLELSPGSAMMLLGRNGSGKTTLINLLALAMRSDSGTVSVDDLEGRAAREAIGFAPQEIALFNELSVEENLRVWCKLPRAAAKERLDSLLERLDLNSMRKKLLRSLSGGQKRRVNLAAALMGNPRYLLADEPLAGADEDSERLMLEMFKEYRANGLGLVIVGHQPRLLRGVAECAMVLERGEISFYGSAEDYFSALEDREL